jgi:hypothetical protein
MNLLAMSRLPGRLTGSVCHSGHAARLCHSADVRVVKSKALYTECKGLCSLHVSASDCVDPASLDSRLTAWLKLTVNFQFASRNLTVLTSVCNNFVDIVGHTVVPDIISDIYRTVEYRH